MTKDYSSGIGLVEVIVSVAILAFSLIGIVGGFNFYLRAGIENTDEIRALYLAEEGIEAVKFLRDGSWDANVAALATGTPYQLAIVGTTWESTTTPVLIDNLFTRTFTLDDVFRRNSDDDIVASTSAEVKTLDPDAKEVAVRVSWADEEVETITYITNLFKQ